MVFESRVTWQKLELELDLLSSEDPHSLIPILVGLNSVLWPEDCCAREVTREFNFMAFELASVCEGLSEKERFDQLNHFFFEEWAFRALGLDSAHYDEDDLLPSSIVDRRQGAPIPIGLLYLHFASHIDLPISLVQAQPQCLLKWVRGGKSHYIDLMQNGQVLSDHELCNWLNRFWGAQPPRSKDLEPLSGKQILNLYIKELDRYYEAHQLWNQQHTLLNVLLRLDPNHSPTLCRRGLLLKKLGYAKEALSDFKQYLSFVELHQAPSEVQLAIYELESLTDESIPPHIDLLH